MNEQVPTEELDLDRLAMTELLQEAKRGAERASTMGTAGWLKPTVGSTNKRFLTSMITGRTTGLSKKLQSNEDPKNDSSSRRREHEKHDKGVPRFSRGDSRHENLRQICHYTKLIKTDDRSPSSRQSKHNKEKRTHSDSRCTDESVTKDTHSRQHGNRSDSVGSSASKKKHKHKNE